MSSKKTSSNVDSIPFAGDDLASSYAVTPIYASSLAASNSYRSSQWYLDGKLTVGGNAYGANVDKISTEYTGAGVKVGIIDQGFDTTNIDLIGRFDLTQSVDPRDTGFTSIMPDGTADAHGTWVSGVIGASATNQTGAVGVAPDSTLVGYYARFGVGGSSAAELGEPAWPAGQCRRFQQQLGLQHGVQRQFHEGFVVADQGRDDQCRGTRPRFTGHGLRIRRRQRPSVCGEHGFRRRQHQQPQPDQQPFRHHRGGVGLQRAHRLLQHARRLGHGDGAGRRDPDDGNGRRRRRSHQRFCGRERHVVCCPDRIGRRRHHARGQSGSRVS